MDKKYKEGDVITIRLNASGASTVNYWDYQLGKITLHRKTPIPPAGQVDAVAESFEDTRNRQLATMQWQDILAFAKADVEGRALFKKFIAGTPLENDIPVWMAEYAVKYQQAALKASGAEHIAGLVGALEDIIDICTDQADGDYNTITEKAMGVWEALPPELRGK